MTRMQPERMRSGTSPWDSLEARGSRIITVGIAGMDNAYSGPMSATGERIYQPIYVMKDDSLLTGLLNVAKLDTFRHKRYPFVNKLLGRYDLPWLGYDAGAGKLLYPSQISPKSEDQAAARAEMKGIYKAYRRQIPNAVKTRLEQLSRVGRLSGGDSVRGFELGTLLLLDLMAKMKVRVTGVELGEAHDDIKRKCRELAESLGISRSVEEMLGSKPVLNTYVVHEQEQKVSDEVNSRYGLGAGASVDAGKDVGLLLLLTLDTVGGSLIPPDTWDEIWYGGIAAAACCFGSHGLNCSFTGNLVKQLARLRDDRDTVLKASFYVELIYCYACARLDNPPESEKVEEFFLDSDVEDPEFMSKTQKVLQAFLEVLQLGPKHPGIRPGDWEVFRRRSGRRS